MHALHSQLPQLYVFRLVAELGSFQAAATQLDLPRSSISKKVTQLEHLMGQRLLQRSTRQLRLTDDGRALLAATQQLDEVLAKANSLKNAQQGEPTGRVKISSSTLIGERFLLPCIGHIRAKYPKIQFDFNITDTVVDMIAQGIDIALRVGRLPDSSLVAKKLGEKSWHCFASPNYLKRHAAPRNPTELKAHTALVFKNGNFAMDHWRFQNAAGEITEIKLDNFLGADNGRALLELATQGCGIVFVDPLLIREEIKTGHLVQVMSDWHHPDIMPIHLVCLGKNARSAAVEAVWSELTDRLPKLLE